MRCPAQVGVPRLPQTPSDAPVCVPHPAGPMHSTHPTNRNLQVGLVGMLYSESAAKSHLYVPHPPGPSYPGTHLNRNLQVGLVGMLYSDSEAMSATAAAAIKVMLTPSPPAAAGAPPALGPEPSLGGALGTAGGAPGAVTASTSFRPSTSRGRAAAAAAAVSQPVAPQKTEAEIMVRCSPMHAWALLRT